MIIVTIKQGYSEVIFETELYPDAELLISTVLGLADNRTSIAVTTTEKSEASYLQEEKDELEEELRSNILKREGVKGTKADTWPSAAIKAMLQNEKYCGDTLMQKTYTVDFLTKKKVKNHGEVDQYFMEDSHEAIIPKDEWQAVQMEFERRDAYKEEVGLHAFGNDSSPFSGRIICSHCGKPYRRCGWSRNGKKFWMCASKKAKDASSCQANNIFEESIFEAFRVAWNGAIANKDNLTEKWDDQIENGNPLERLRAKQMKMLIAEANSV